MKNIAHYYTIHNCFLSIQDVASLDELDDIFDWSYLGTGSYKQKYTWLVQEFYNMGGADGFRITSEIKDFIHEVAKKHNVAEGNVETSGSG